MPWSLLAGAFLTGNIAAKIPATPAGWAVSFLQQEQVVDRNWDFLDALKFVAGKIDRPAVQVALAWAMARPGIVSTVIGAKSTGR